MKAHRLLGIIMTLVMLFTLAGTVSAAAEKVPVCHLDEYGVYHFISISDNAWDAHEAHGDQKPGDLVPEQPWNKFDVDCSVIPSGLEQYEFVESIQVQSTAIANGSMWTKKVSYFTIPLTLGQEYQLRASGTYKYANWGAPAGYADAKFSNRIASVPPYVSGWIDGANLNADPLKAYGLQVTIYDGDAEKPLTPVGWVEAYNDAHKYTAPFTGTGSTLGLFIWDDQYSDNSGYITVELYKVNW